MRILTDSLHHLLFQLTETFYNTVKTTEGVEFDAEQKKRIYDHVKETIQFKVSVKNFPFDDPVPVDEQAVALEMKEMEEERKKPPQLASWDD